MSQLFVYIATRSTVDPYLPIRQPNMDLLSRDVADAFSAISGGHLLVGRLAFFPAQRSVPNHLLCDGREVDQASFPELYGYLGLSEGTAATGKFKLPNYLTGISAATTADTETTDAGTSSTPPPTDPPPATFPGTTTPIYGDVDSGGRPRLRPTGGEAAP